MARKPVSVTQLNSYMARMIQTDPILGNISVRGEISNLKYHGSGHIFFTLKDEGSSVRCFLPSGYADMLQLDLADGMEVIASGHISVFERGGSYSLNVRAVEVSGEGGLMAAYRALYDKLKNRGYFDISRKKNIPVFPKTVCVITSETGAAVRDILKIIRQRNRHVRVIVYPCLVQGPNAAADIASALGKVNERFPETDVIILGRGGGSLEDLWAFNEEPVAEAIFRSKIPVISAVGHETDYTIADFAADRRAETPSAAAAMAVPDVKELMTEAGLYLDAVRDRLSRVYEVKYRSLQMYSPEKTLDSLKYLIKLKSSLLQTCSPDVMKMQLRNAAAERKSALDRCMDQMRNDAHSRLEHLKNEVGNCRIVIESADPELIIRRGYAVVTDEKGIPVTDAGSVCRGDVLNIKLRNGAVRSIAEEIFSGGEADEPDSGEMKG